MTDATANDSCPVNTATQRFATGQRVRVLPHVGAPHLTGREGTIVDFPAPALFGTGDYGAHVRIDGLTWHLYSHRIEAA